MRALVLSACFFVMNLAFNLSIAKGWADAVPNWVVAVLWIVPLIPLGWWAYTHERLIRQRAWITAQFSQSKSKAVTITVGSAVIVLVCAAGIGLGLRKIISASHPPNPDSCPDVAVSDRVFTRKTPRDIRSLFEGKTIVQGQALTKPFACVWIGTEGQATDIYSTGGGYGMQIRTSPQDIVECHFSSTWADQIGRMSNGDAVKIIGRIDPLQNGAQLYLSSCELKD